MAQEEYLLGRGVKADSSRLQCIEPVKEALVTGVRHWASRKQGIAAYSETGSMLTD